MYYVEDYASMMEWFEENETCFIIPFIEQTFRQVSWEYELDFMREHLIYTKNIIEDFQMSDNEKLAELINHVYHGKSKIILVVGSRGAGKTATALYLAEQAKLLGGHRSIYYVGYPEYKEMYPLWFRFVDTIDKIPNNSFAIIDEAAIKYSARDFQSTGNKQLTEQMVIARHKDITLVLITQNIKLVDINVNRLADIIIFKMGSNYGLERRKGEIMTKEKKEQEIIVRRMKPRTKEECMVLYSSGSYPIYRRFKNPLPTFWDDEKISKSHRHYKKQEEDTPKQIQRRVIRI